MPNANEVSGKNVLRCKSDLKNPVIKWQQQMHQRKQYLITDTAWCSPHHQTKMKTSEKGNSRHGGDTPVSSSIMVQMKSLTLELETITGILLKEVGGAEDHPQELQHEITSLQEITITIQMSQ